MDKTFETEMRKRGYDPVLCWQIKGPPHTGVLWISGYFVGRIIVIHQTYKSGGWEVYSSYPSASREDAINDVIARMHPSPSAAA